MQRVFTLDRKRGNRLEDRLKLIVCIFLSAVILSACAKDDAVTSSAVSEQEPESRPSETKKPWYDTTVPDNYVSFAPESSDEEESSATESKNPSVSQESSEPTYVPTDDELVLITDYLPDIVLDIRYATENNFTEKVIYESSDAYLRYGTLKKLIEVENELNSLGYRLLIWDAYRPTAAQWKLWEVCPDPNFVSDPNNGYSSHSRGNTVDVTIIRMDKSNAEMPSGFDEFGTKADRDYSDVSVTAAENAKLLEDIMIKHGFSGYRKEWWHYTDTVKYEIVE